VSGAAGPRQIVFYGSLLEGLPLADKPDLAALGLGRAGPCRVPGVLYDTGEGYPALTRGVGEVVGELWGPAGGGEPDATLGADVLRQLDAFEGAEYRREAASCLEPAGVAAWVYVWDRPVDGLVLITGGDWRAWIA
jgi:gamma-glutamylcyclotransferase (GGCT)/AIG2-like uncharacterized protein YtfP